MKKSYFLIVAAAAIFLLSGCSNQPPVEKNNSASNSKNTQPVDNTKSEAISSFDISAKPFEFSLKEIKVKKGTKVKINLTVTQGMHDFVVDEFNARTKQITTGQADSIEFTADKSGTFEYYCSVGTHRQMGMVGKLIVEE
jgi:nitrite reductase (NO-forming)